MAHYPISHNGGKSLGEYFSEILAFHIPPSKEKHILDPTCGKSYLWTEFLNVDLRGERKIDQYGKVVHISYYYYLPVLVNVSQNT